MFYYGDTETLTAMFVCPHRVVELQDGLDGSGVPVLQQLLGRLAQGELVLNELRGGRAEPFHRLGLDGRLTANLPSLVQLLIRWRSLV